MGSVNLVLILKLPRELLEKRGGLPEEIRVSKLPFYAFVLLFLSNETPFLDISILKNHKTVDYGCRQGLRRFRQGNNRRGKSFVRENICWGN